MSYNYSGGYGGQSGYQNGGPGMDRGYGRGPQQFHNSPTNPSFSAPVMRMDTGRDRDYNRSNGDQGNRGRTGLGAGLDTRNLERDRQQVRENMMLAQPPTREEVARTIFIGGLGDGAPPDSAIEAILGSAGKLRRWTRARDAEEKKCRFGFAEFEDVDSLETAKELFEGGIEVPVFADGKLAPKDGKDSAQEMMKILVVIDEQSTAYIDEWMSKRRDGKDAKQFRIDHAKEDLARCLTALVNGNSFAANGGLDDVDGTDDAEYIEIPKANEDELADIPAEMRATVALEIKAFRERSNRRDIDLSRSNAAETRNFNRLASPPVNGAPSGPKSAVTGAPAGPKGYRGVQLPSDYVNGVSFVNGIDGGLADDDDSDSSDLTLENRRVERRKEEQEKLYREAEQRWIRQENRHIAAQKRDFDREAAERQDLERKRELEAQRMETWDDEEEMKAREDVYYEDHSSWKRRRQAQREREAREDDRDRENEEREKESEQRRAEDARGAADRFLAETGAELNAKQAETMNFTFNIGSMQKPAPNARRTLNDVAGMLEDEEDETGPGHRELRQISNLPTNGDTEMSDSDVAARRALIKQIPTDADSLFAWEVRWSYIRSEVLENEIRPFVEKRVADLLGMADDFLVGVVMDGLKAQKSAEQFIQELEPVLEEETVPFVKKVWRLVVFWGEAESRRGIA